VSGNDPPDKPACRSGVCRLIRGGELHVGLRDVDNNVLIWDTYHSQGAPPALCVCCLADVVHQCPQRNRHESSPRLASYRDAYVQPQPQKKVARAYRIKGSIILYRSPARNVFNAERSPLRAKPWWSMVFGAPLFLRTLLRLVFVCPHRHRGPPITMRESIPSGLPGCRSVDGRGTYITCLDCGQRFAYNHKSRRLVDFWGVRDAEALAGVRRRVYDFFSPLRSLAARVGMLNMRILIRKPVRSVHRLGVLTKGH
jgi:hypothetical protein